MSTLLVILALLTPLLVGAGCADTIGIATQDDLSQLRDEVTQLRQDVGAIKGSMQRSRTEAEARLQTDRQIHDQQGEIQRQVALLQSRIEGLAADVKRQASRLDELSREIETRTRQSGVAPPQPTLPSTSPRVAAPQEPTGPQPADIYQAAYLDFSKGNYPLAIAGFREFVRKFPDSPQADRAQYLIGEAYFSQASMHATKGETEKAEQAFEQAVQEFRKVTVNYPRGDKVPTALYKEALALLELKRQSLARARLQYLLDHFPQSEEAPLARERLAGLKETG